jgi:hypothetical protein
VSLDYFDRAPFRFNRTIHPVAVRYAAVHAPAERQTAAATTVV